MCWGCFVIYLKHVIMCAATFRIVHKPGQNQVFICNYLSQFFDFKITILERHLFSEDFSIEGESVASAS